MSTSNRERVGFTCAYTPLPLLHAAGLNPYRILPVGDLPDQAGSVLHDNLCPHVKRLLDRALASDLPELAGVAIMASCDTMRRLADAWAVARPADRLVLVDLPTGRRDADVAYLASELARLRDRLSAWTGRDVAEADLAASVALYNELARGVEQLAARVAAGTLTGGRAGLQQLLLDAVTLPPEEVLDAVRARLAEPAAQPDRGLPVYLFGNVLPEPEGYALLEDCGARIVSDDLCTGLKQVVATPPGPPDHPLLGLAAGLMGRPPCARTLDAHRPLGFADQVVEAVVDSGACGVVAHVMKFCDPYLARLPAVREALKARDIPLLALEGDCTLRSLGQHRTRIEAFVEMLQEARS